MPPSTRQITANSANAHGCSAGTGVNACTTAAATVTLADAVPPTLPAVVPMVPPPHDPMRPLGVATASPAGNVSTNAMPDSVPDTLGLCSVKVSDVLPFIAIVAAPKASPSVGGAMPAVTVAQAE